MSRRYLFAEASIISIVLFFAASLQIMAGGAGNDVMSGPTSTHDGQFSLSAWTFPWDDDDLPAFEGWSEHLDTVSPYWYYAYPDGSISPSHPETGSGAFIELCTRHEIELVPMVSNIHDPFTVKNITRDPDLQIRHIQALVDLVISEGYDGLDMNYESILSEDRDFYSGFILNLSARMHGIGKKVYVSVFPKVAPMEGREGPDGYDYVDLSRNSDGIRIMAYNLHWSTSPMAGPITSLPWMEDVLDYAITAADPEKIHLALPQWAYDWPIDDRGRTKGTAVNLSFRDVERIVSEYGSERKWNHTSRTPFYRYKDRSGRMHEIDMCDSESLLHHMQLVDRYSLAGVCIWKIGGEDPLSRSFMGPLKEGGTSNLPPYIDIGNDIVEKRGVMFDLGPVKAYDIDGWITDVRWDLGDGNSSEVIEAEHAYMKGGVYTARLTLTDNEGRTVHAEKTVRIGPHAVMNADGPFDEGVPIIFDGSGSWDPDGIISYNWDMGDGKIYFHHPPNITHIYEGPGEYLVSLTVISSDGYSDVHTEMVSIPDTQPPVAIPGADMIIWEDSYAVLDGRASTDNGVIKEYLWTVSDGRRSEGDVTRIWFDNPGLFVIGLTVIDEVGSSSHSTMELLVRDRTPPELLVEHPDIVLLGERIDMNLFGSRDNVGIENITWDLGNGRKFHSTYELSFYPDAPGRNHFTVSVMDAEGNWNSTSFHVDVKDVEPPRSNVVITPEPRYVSEIGYLYLLIDDGCDRMLGAEKVILQDQTYIFSHDSIFDETEISSIHWFFGDGSSATGQIVYHGFERSGIYDIETRIVDVWGNARSTTTTLLVVPSWNMTMEEVMDFREVHINRTVQVIEGSEDEGADPYPVLVILASIILVAIVVWDCVLIVRKVIFVTRRTKEDWK